jgi:hypothetical protein
MVALIVADANHLELTQYGLTTKADGGASGAFRDSNHHVDGSHIRKASFQRPIDQSITELRPGTTSTVAARTPGLSMLYILDRGTRQIRLLRLVLSSGIVLWLDRQETQL